VPEALVHLGVHPSLFPDRVQAGLISSLRLRRIDPKFHYESRKQARAWLRLHECHSPARRDRQYRETYLRAFADVAQRLHPGDLQIVALGCGHAEKECMLIDQLPGPQTRVSFVAIDLSAPLALIAHTQASQRLPHDRCHALICDLAAASDLARHLNHLLPPGARRLVTCFGVLPNFTPKQILPRLAALLAPGDQLLLSANLAPDADFSASLNAILPQYDNPLTRQWLFLLLDDLGVDPADGQIRFSIEPDPAWTPLARIAAHFEFERPRSLIVDTEEFRFLRGDRLGLFFSYRHTRASVHGLLASSGIRTDADWTVPSGEEGLFLATADEDHPLKG
jgi:L-histidine Nalpha-methyltransferase